MKTIRTLFLILFSLVVLQPLRAAPAQVSFALVRRDGGRLRLCRSHAGRRATRRPQSVHGRRGHGRVRPRRRRAAQGGWLLRCRRRQRVPHPVHADGRRAAHVFGALPAGRFRAHRTPARSPPATASAAANCAWTRNTRNTSSGPARANTTSGTAPPPITSWAGRTTRSSARRLTAWPRSR